MGFLDRFLGRNKSVESGESKENLTSGVSVSFEIFKKFQEDTRQGMQSMRGEFNKLVEENLALKKQVMAVTNRLDEIQIEQNRQGLETRAGLNNLSKSIWRVEMGGKLNSSTPAIDSLNEIPNDQKKKIEDAKNALIRSINSTENMRMFDRLSDLKKPLADVPKRKPG